MPAPGNDYINEAVDVVTAAIKASPLFMAADAPDPPAGASGVVRYVEKDLPETGPRIPDYRLPHAGVVYLGHEPMRSGTAGVSDYVLEVGIRLYSRGADRDAVWDALQKAAAAVTVLAETEHAGGRFDGFAIEAWDKGGTPVDTVEKDGGFGAVLFTGIVMKIRRFY